MATVDTTAVKSKSKLLVIVLLIIILTLGSIIFFIVRSDNLTGLVEVLKPKEEYTLILDEFVVNLKSDSRVQRYLKIKIALMYSEEKQQKTVEASISKIRDVILEDLRAKTYEEILDGNNTVNIKKTLLDNINLSLNEDIIKDLYITDLIVQ